MPPRVTDAQREKLRKAIEDALMLAYFGSVRETLAFLGKYGVNPLTQMSVQRKIAEKATETARLAQEGINTRTDSAAEDGSVSGVLAGVRVYNEEKLVPNILSWARHQGIRDTMLAQPDPKGRADNALKGTLWQWFQYTDFQDDCTTAANLGIAPYDDLVAAAGGSEPPVHRRCQCDLLPLGWRR